jgi:hypothetical protein
LAERGARLFPPRNLLFTLEFKNYLAEESFGPLSRESSNMAESKGSAAQPRFRDVVATLRPQVTFWWGSGLGVIASAIAVAALLAFGIFTINTAGLVSLDSDKVALRIQTELEDAGINTVVDCPDELVAPVGFLFVCMAQTPDGAVAQVETTIVNVLGDVIWDLRSDLPVNG